MNFFLESLWLGLNNKTDAERQFFLKDKSFKKGSIKQTNKIGIVIIILDKIEWKILVARTDILYWQKCTNHKRFPTFLEI